MNQLKGINYDNRIVFAAHTQTDSLSSSERRGGGGKFRLKFTTSGRTIDTFVARLFALYCKGKTRKRQAKF